MLKTPHEAFLIAWADDSRYAFITERASYKAGFHAAWNARQEAVDEARDAALTKAIEFVREAFICARDAYTYDEAGKMIEADLEKLKSVKL